MEQNCKLYTENGNPHTKDILVAHFLESQVLKHHII